MSRKAFKRHGPRRRVAPRLTVGYSTQRPTGSGPPDPGMLDQFADVCTIPRAGGLCRYRLVGGRCPIHGLVQ